ncbi:MAG: FAD-dependent monooxygenase [Planctomycetes bacterium]|nr:FAD-dependent monooxygenase [Planctomycetota bacterium]
MPTRFDDEADVVVIGAGIAGLGLCCALASSGLDVLLVDARKGPGGIHRGDSLVPRSTRLLAAWGALDAVRAAGAVPIERIEVHHPTRGLLLEGPLVPDGVADPYLVLPHADLERVLLAEAVRLGRTRVLRPARLDDLLRDDRGRVVGARLVTRDGGERAVRARLVVGADGQRSAVRERLGVEVRRGRYDHAYLGLEAERPAAYRDALRLHLHPEGGVLVMPRPDRVGLGVLVEAGGAPRWTGMSDDALGRALAARCPLLVGTRLLRGRSHVYELTWSHARRYQQGGAVLIGDAAHTTNPTAGQGMTSALGDADALAREVGPALASGGDLDAALARFERRQRPINARLVRQADLLARLYAWRGPLGDAAKVLFARALGSPAGALLARGLTRAFLVPAEHALARGGASRAARSCADVPMRRPQRSLGRDDAEPSSPPAPPAAPLLPLAR